MLIGQKSLHIVELAKIRGSICTVCPLPPWILWLILSSQRSVYACRVNSVSKMEVPTAIRELIVNLRKQGHSYRKIGQTVNKGYTTVRYILKRYEESGSVKSAYRSGRPPVLQTHHKRAIIRTVAEEPHTSASNLAAMIHKNYNIYVSPQTIRRILKNAGYNGRRPRRKPFISKKKDFSLQKNI